MESLKKELIGLTLKVVDSKNKANIGLQGEIIDETKNMLIIKTKDESKKLIKDQSVFEIEFKDGKKKIEGILLVARPHERIKFKVKKV